MYNCTTRSISMYLRKNKYTPTVTNGTIFLNDWYIQVNQENDYITVSHPAVFPTSLSFPFCDFDNLIAKLHRFVAMVLNMHIMHAFKPLK